MNTLLKGCSCIILGSGVCALPFLHLSSDWDDSALNLIFSADSTSKEGKSESWKCSSISGANEIFDHPHKVTASHVTFYCASKINDVEGRGRTKIGLGWIIWVPLTTLTRPWDFLESGKDIVINTQTTKVKVGSNEAYGNKTTFQSDSFNNKTIVGTWGIDIGSWKRVGSEQIYRFTSTESGLDGDFIYLKIKQ